MGCASDRVCACGARRGSSSAADFRQRGGKLRSGSVNGRADSINGSAGRADSIKSAPLPG